MEEILKNTIIPIYSRKKFVPIFYIHFDKPYLLQFIKSTKMRLCIHNSIQFQTNNFRRDSLIFFSFTALKLMQNEIDIGLLIIFNRVTYFRCYHFDILNRGAGKGASEGFKWKINDKFDKFWKGFWASSSDPTMGTAPGTGMELQYCNPMR